MFKIASIGKSLPTIESMSFKNDSSWTDFDVLIVNPDSVVNELLQIVERRNNEYIISGSEGHDFFMFMQHRKREIESLLKSGKIIITFLTPLVQANYRVSRDASVRTNNYSWLPSSMNPLFDHRFVGARGTELRLSEKKHPFAGYYQAFKGEMEYSAYIDKDITRFTLGDAFISNSTNHVAGFSSKLDSGYIVFLPTYEDSWENDGKFEGVMLGILNKHFEMKTFASPPDWTENFVIPATKIIETQIVEIQNRIDKLEQEKEDAETQRENLEEYKLLLYGQGHNLERVVIKSLELMGFKAETIRHELTDFDVVLESKEGRAIAEVEGKDDNDIHKEKIDQLNSALTIDLEKGGIMAKGVLIGNHYAKKNPQERGKPFTDTVEKIALRFHCALITTYDLYKVVLYILENQEDEAYKKSCRELILGSDGLVIFPES